MMFGNLKKWRLLLLGVLFALQVGGQPFQFSFHKLSPLEGLSQGTNSFVYRDTRGFVWLSSIDGLNRFDGKTVKVYKAGPATGLYDNIITSSFYEDEQANLWFTTYEGVHCYLREQDRIVHHFLLDEKQDTLRQDYFAFHLDSDQNFWVRTGLGEAGRLHRFNTRSGRDQIVCPLTGDRINVVVNDEGEVASLVSNSLSSRAGIEIRSMTPPYASSFFFSGADELPALKCSATLTKGGTNLWLATENALVGFNPETRRIAYYDHYEGKAIGAVWAIASLDDQHLIISTAAAGVLVFDEKQGRFVQQIPFTPDDPFGLSLRSVNAFYLDAQENLWISSARNGLNYSNLKKRKFRVVDALRNTAVTALYQTKDGRVWCNGKAGEVLAFSADTDTHQVYQLRSNNSGVPNRKVAFFFEDEEGDLWACHGRYLFKWEESEAQFSYIQSMPSTALYVYHSKSEGVLVSTYSGIYRATPFEGELRVEQFAAIGAYQPQLATALYEDLQGRLYLALDATRLVVLEKQKVGYVKRKQIEQVGYAKSFTQQGDTLWVATTNGILVIDLQDLENQLLNERDHRAPQENYYCVLPDADGRLWLSCNQGIVRYDSRAEEYHRYNLADGLQDIEYNTNAFLRTSDGRFWMGGNKGLNVFYPSDIQRVPYAPQLQLVDLLINDEPYVTPIQVGELESLDLAFSDNTISVMARALEYSDPANNRFQYRLVNYDEEWVDGGNNGFVRYPNLPPGQYRLQFKAANSDGVWSVNPRELSIYVRTPWWRQWWFYLSCTLAIVAIVYAVFSYRLQQALKVERIRVKISADLHDDVGSILTGLAMQAEVVELTAKEENKPKLNHISELSRSALSRMRDTVWAIDARKDKLENLLFRMQEHAEETLTPRGMQFGLAVDSNLDLNKNLPANIRQNFYLIYKEAITNAAKHSAGSHVMVKLNKRRQGIEMLIHSNGVVGVKNYKTSGLGVSNMQMRAEQMGAAFEIDTTNGYLIKVALEQIK